MFAAKNELFTTPSGYQIQRSLRFRSSASAYLNRTPAGAGTSNKTFTYSAWVKRGSLGAIQNLISSPNASDTDSLRFSAADKLEYNWQDTVAGQVTTTQVFRDPSAWYHIVFAMDTTQATASNRFKLYVNGVQVTAFATASYPAQNTVVNNTAAVATKLGQYANSGAQSFDGYMTEVNFIDGQQLTPSSFGAINATTGVWSATRYNGTYGTNGFYLNFTDNSAATATTIGKDYSGNGNNWTPNNISVTAGVTYDSMLDAPLGAGGGERGNYCVMNPLKLQTNMRLTNGNLDVSSTDTGSAFCAFGSIVMSSGSWYAEYTINTSTGNFPMAGIGDLVKNPNTNEGLGDSNGTAYQRDGRVIVNNSTIGTFATFTNGDVIGVAYDATNNRIYFAKNNTYINSGNPSAGTGYFSPAAPVLGYVFGTSTYSAGSCSINFGQRPFAYTPPTGFKALHTGNLGAPVIPLAAQYMAATTYTGTGATQSISNAVNSVSMQPDWVWFKRRGAVENHWLTDSVRGSTKGLFSNLTDAEATRTDQLTSFNSNGFTLGADAAGYSNVSGQSYVAWQWKAGGTAVSNTSGSITSSVSANVSAGFSVVAWTGIAGGQQTVGHGLGVAPVFIISKNRTDSATAWYTATGFLSGWNWSTDYFTLNTTAAKATDGGGTVFPVAPTSTVFTVGDAATNGSGKNYVAYCFAPVAGYSAFGSYTGNGSADGPFVYLGFRPRFVLVKSSSNTFEWVVRDSTRSTYNLVDSVLNPNSSAAEVNGGGYGIDFLSNGFKVRAAGSATNGNTFTYIYMAFAEDPFKNSLAR